MELQVTSTLTLAQTQAHTDKTKLGAYKIHTVFQLHFTREPLCIGEHIS